MGAGVAKCLERCVSDVGPGSAWAQKDLGPTLRRFFGAYVNGDIWALYRRYKQVDSHNCGYVGYEELPEIVQLPEFNLLFLWDAFSHQNSLFEGRELLIIVCIFSSASLAEKCRFLLTLHDASHSGTITGAEVAELATACLGVLARCTGQNIRPKEVAAVLQDDLPNVLQAFREAAKVNGPGPAFKTERIISNAELDMLAASLRGMYQELPIGQDPPPGALKPPEPDWNVGKEEIVAAGSGTSAVRTLAGKKLTQAELLQMAVMGGVSAEVGDEDAAKDSSTLLLEMQLARDQELERSQAATASMKPAKGWLVIHGADFATVSKDFLGFRHSLVKSISQALRVPGASIEVVEITADSVEITAGSVVVELLIHPSARAGDIRDAKELLIQIAQQLSDKQSSMRCGSFASYAASAELLTGTSRKTATPPLGIGDTVRCDQATQHCDPSSVLDEVLARLEVEKVRAERAEAAHRAALEELAKREATIISLTQAKHEEDMELFAQELRQLEELRKVQSELPPDHDTELPPDDVTEGQKAAEEEQQEDELPTLLSFFD